MVCFVPECLLASAVSNSSLCILYSFQSHSSCDLYRENIRHKMLGNGDRFT